MIGTYVGHLNYHDPLYGYLRDEIYPQVDTSCKGSGFRVFQPANSRHVYAYQEVDSGLCVIAKFHPPKPQPAGVPVRTGETEYRNLLFVRSLGLETAPYYVVRPLGYNPQICNALVMEYLEGDLLGKVISDAVYLGRRERLFRKLSGMAHFLAVMHDRLAGELPVDFQNGYDYMWRLINSLIVKRGMGPDHSDELYRLRDAWRSRSCMWEDRSIFVHGDVTPSNFLVGRGHDIMAIDLERMQWMDRSFDIGRLCGELKHLFFQGSGDRYAAEPFINHFLREYCSHFPDRNSAFRAITKRLPFYMGITLLRIARNVWIPNEYRWRLVREAKTILRALP